MEAITSYGTIVHYAYSRFSSAVGTVSVQLVHLVDFE